MISSIYLDNLQVNLRYIFQSGMTTEDIERVLQRVTFALYQKTIWMHSESHIILWGSALSCMERPHVWSSSKKETQFKKPFPSKDLNLCTQIRLRSFCIVIISYSKHQVARQDICLCTFWLSGENDYFRINCSSCSSEWFIVKKWKQILKSFILTTLYKWDIFNWAQDIRYDGRRLFKSKIIDIVEFWGGVDIDEPVHAFKLLLTEVEFQLFIKFDDPLATPTGHLRLLWDQFW